MGSTYPPWGAVHSGECLEAEIMGHTLDPPGVTPFSFILPPIDSAKDPRPLQWLKSHRISFW